MAEIKKWVTKQDGLDNLRYTTGPMPEPKEGEVLVQINAVSINYRDTEVIMGLYNHHKSVGQAEDLVPCSDICGTIVKPGGQWKEGQRVMAIFNQTHLVGQIKEKDMASGLGLPLQGCLTEYRCFPAEALVAVPDYMTDEEASCLPIASVTAWMAINGFQPIGQPISDRKTVLLQGTGGVSIAGLQIAHAAGLKTIVTSSSDTKLQQAAKLGADHGINYKSTSQWQEEVMKLTNNEGADIIFETGGAQTLRKSFDCITFGGIIVAIGYLSGKEDSSGESLHTNVLALRRNVTLKGVINGPRERFEEMADFYAQKQIHPVIDKVFTFDQAKDAIKYLYSGSHFGKVVVKVA
ncbi:Zinc-type alcohol dehydrogenase-like protein [Pseudocercospora fuligena]|uniref:Zinc-type alcohol dehydrogenase-like protein n=1 Tax=Pseudocercospora fuligena TaxID=685502 RepID=A0A8H6RI65_9PEZI|nr:Zinc-type alcohol dehydrogenase-like protein [Pseudocercospora fuligena]